MELNKIYQMDCIEGMKRLPDESIDLTVTSPPYDNLRDYEGYDFTFNTIDELFRVTKFGGVVVWVVGDSTVKGSETLTSFKQALHFKEVGFNVHDTMIWKKRNPMPVNDKRYQQSFEYMFVFSKGKPKTVNLIKVPKSKTTSYRQQFKVTTTQKGKNGKNVTPTIYEGKDRPNLTKKKNVWEYYVGFNAKNDRIASKHPAIFPEKLAKDHIISWSNEGDVVLDPFMGSGTTAKMALVTKRNYLGFEVASEYIQIAQKRIADTKELMQDGDLFTLDNLGEETK